MLHLFSLTIKLTEPKATIFPKMTGFEVAQVFLKQMRHWGRNWVAQGLTTSPPSSPLLQRKLLNSKLHLTLKLSVNTIPQLKDAMFTFRRCAQMPNFHEYRDRSVNYHDNQEHIRSNTWLANVLVIFKYYIFTQLRSILFCTIKQMLMPVNCFTVTSWEVFTILRSSKLPVAASKPSESHINWSGCSRNNNGTKTTGGGRGES